MRKGSAIHCSEMQLSPNKFSFATLIQSKLGVVEWNFAIHFPMPTSYANCLWCLAQKASLHPDWFAISQGNVYLTLSTKRSCEHLWTLSVADHCCAMAWSGGAQHRHRMETESGWKWVHFQNEAWNLSQMVWLNTPGEMSFSIDSYPTSLQHWGYIFFWIENWKIMSNWSASRHLSFMFLRHLQPKFPQHALHTLACHAKHDIWVHYCISRYIHNIAFYSGNMMIHDQFCRPYFRHPHGWSKHGEESDPLWSIEVVWVSVSLGDFNLHTRSKHHLHANKNKASQSLVM